MKKIIGRSLLVLIVVLLAAFAFYYSTISRTFNVANGFTAKNICSGYFVSGFSQQAIMNEALVPLSETFSYVDVQIDESNKKVTTQFFGAFERNAIFTDGIGCTLLAPGETQLARIVKKAVWPTPLAILPWPNGNAEITSQATNIDNNKLQLALDQAFTEPSSLGGRRTKAITIILDGELIAEKYAPEVNQFTPLLSWSMAKSITNMQVGLLVKEGRLDINAPANVPLWKQKPEKDSYNEITLDHLLRMSSGLAFSEVYGIDSDATYMLSVASSASNFASDKPIEFPTDTHWAYSSGTSNIVSGIIKRTIGGDFQNYYQYTQENLFRPLNIASAQLETDAEGTFIGSSYSYLSTRDWAKLGQLFLQDGVWNKQRILPENWVNYSITPTKTNFINNYGAHFWLNQDPNETLLSENKLRTRKWPSLPTDTYFMGGFQGQYVVVIPSKKLVVVRMGFTTPRIDSGIETLITDVIEALEVKEK